MPQALDPTDPQPLSDFGAAARRLRYGVLGDGVGSADIPDRYITIEDISAASAVVYNLDERGWQLVMIVSDAAMPALAVRASPLPPASMTSPKLWDVDRRFRTNERFARALFGVLDVAGRVYGPRPARGFSIDFDQRQAP